MHVALRNSLCCHTWLAFPQFWACCPIPLHLWSTTTLNWYDRVPPAPARAVICVLELRAGVLCALGLTSRMILASDCTMDTYLRSCQAETRSRPLQSILQTHCISRRPAIWLREWLLSIGITESLTKPHLSSCTLGGPEQFLEPIYLVCSLVGDCDLEPRLVVPTKLAWSWSYIVLDNSSQTTTVPPGKR